MYDQHVRNRSLRWILLAAVAAFLLGAPTAAADRFTVYGQVFQVDRERAADPEVEDAELGVGPAMPFVRVRVVDAATGDLLGQGHAGATGNFAIAFTADPGPTVEVRAFRVIEDRAELLPAAREGINTFTLTSRRAGVAVRVLSDEAVGPGEVSISDPLGVGIVFTQVGNVEIPFISQDLDRPDKGRIGLADLSSNPERALELNLPHPDSDYRQAPFFRDAPFGGRLLIFGVFGRPFGLLSRCRGDIDWYRVKIRPITGDTSEDGTAFIWAGSMSKMRYEIDFDPFRIDARLDKVGPFDGQLHTKIPDMGWLMTPISGLYRVNPMTSSDTAVVVYSLADLRVNWNTRDPEWLEDPNHDLWGNPSGLVEVSMDYYRQIGGTDTAPAVERIPDTCFNGSLPPGDEDNFALHRLFLRVDNHPLTTGFEGIYIRSNQSPLPPLPYFGGPDEERTDKSGAFDFNGTEYKCEIMALDKNLNDVVEIDFKARHEGGYLLSYALTATPNAGSVVEFVKADYEHDAGAGPIWYGVPADPNAVETASNALDGHFQSCAYIFDLVVRSRVQNGYGYLQGRHHRRAYYIHAPEVGTPSATAAPQAGPRPWSRSTTPEGSTSRRGTGCGSATPRPTPRSRSTAGPASSSGRVPRGAAGSPPSTRTSVAPRWKVCPRPCPRAAIPTGVAAQWYGAGAGRPRTIHYVKGEMP